MKFEKKQVFYVVLAFVLCYAIQANWDNGANIVTTVYKTSLPFLYGAAVAYIVNIVMSAYERAYTYTLKPFPFAMKARRGFCMLLAYFTFISLIVWIISIVIPDLIASISSLTQFDTRAIKEVISDLGHNKLIARAINYIGGDAKLTETITNYSQQLLKQFIGVLTGILTSVTAVASAIINVVISFVFSLYVLASKEELCQQATTLIDTYTGKYAKTVHYLVSLLHSRFRGFFVSQTLEAMILGSLTAIGMFILQLPFAGTIGVLVAFTALIPVVGASIGAAIGFVLIMTQSMSQAVVFIVFLVILQQIEGNFIYPRVVGGSIGLPAMWVLMAITIGAALKGIVGMIVAVPLAATLYQVVKDHIHKKQALQNRQSS
ncbi:TPA: AI-2E family transporter [Streptococcus equi subsp. zooepidemicus]|uniref:AI-2E family transporter n=1 Tax=Streptococcus equi TaxID=1336 RepID=UPI0024A81419|nr:AI-2E family transporter [Streptococcus equi]MDI5951715.1 AI-2E family transporter [Streptococcus equi subsp. zooepidemicus]MDI6073925.1 AI-2E family transporter [Streptococcus equi subsp. zooepidemicus]HEK9954372.1 AI-2E family transporter [Streptococcus equi subsp. zooepidemicus]HEK9956110.1 AI-2E family transporter [Streptococcus equi subsp. zooepidemicus]HEK9993101.1 AI-2E family transporter [Streptococcus equi subsp. zooepidemicus]